MTAISMTGGSLRQAEPRKALALTVRGRRVLAALLLAPLGLGVGLIAAQAPSALAGDDRPLAGAVEEFESHTVLPGETLWDIAAGMGVDGDVRDVVAEIMRLNALPSATLQAGQQLALPNL